MEYDVTIGIPVFQSETCILRALESALSQSYASIEFLIVDDCGMDHSMDIIANLQETHKRGKEIRIIHHDKNLGVSVSRNDIIREARGEYIYFMDSDDMIADNAISLLMENVLRYQAEIAVGSYEKIELSGKRIVYQYPNLLFLSEDQLASFAFRKYAGFQVSSCNFLVKSSILRDYGLWFVNASYWEDMAFTYQLVTYVTRAVLLSDITYYYYCRTKSLSHYQERSIIAKDEVLKNAWVVDYLKKYSYSLSNKVYYPNWCYNLLMTDFYIVCNVLKRRHVIFPRFTDRELREMMLHPASFKQIYYFRQLRLKNFFFWGLGKLPSMLCVLIIMFIGKVKKLI